MPITYQEKNDTNHLRVPPHSIESEHAVIGSLLLENGAWDRIADVISSSDFYRYDHRLIFQHIIKLITTGRPADVITVYESLESEGRGEEVGGLPYLNSMAQNTPSAINVRRYAEIVRERGIQRKLLTAYDELSARVFQPNGMTTREMLDEAETKILSIAEEGARISQRFLVLDELLADVVERVDDLYSKGNQGDVTGIPTGFDDLDKMTSGMHPGELIIVAGRPSMGKTAFSMNVAENVAARSGLPVAVFSMEMSGAQLAMRLLGSAGRIDQHRLRTGQLTDEEWPRMTHGIQKLQQTPFYIDETSALTVQELRARARRLKRQCGKMGVVIVDYMQLMAVSSEGENRASEISEISRNLKWLAKELDCPVIALSQLNRSLEQRSNKRPIMSDLRESGAIEQDADVILFIYRDEVYNPDSQDKGIAELIIGKQRNGPIGTVRTTFNGQHTRFDNYMGSKLNI